MDGVQKGVIPLEKTKLINFSQSPNLKTIILTIHVFKLYLADDTENMENLVFRKCLVLLKLLGVAFLW